MRSVVNEFPSLPSSSRRPMATIIILHYNKQYNRTLSFCIRGRGVDSLCWVPVQVSALLGYDTPTQGLMMLMMMPMLIISGTLISATRCSWRVELNQMEMEAGTKHIWSHSSFMMAEKYPGECPKYAFHGLPLKTFLWIKMAHDLTFCCCSSVNKDNFIVGHSRYWLLIPIYTSLVQLMIFRSTCPVLSRFVRKCWPRENWKTHSGGGMEAAEVNQFTNGLLRHSLWIMFDGKWRNNCQNDWLQPTSHTGEWGLFYGNNIYTGHHRKEFSMASGGGVCENRTIKDRQTKSTRNGQTAGGKYFPVVRNHLKRNAEDDKVAGNNISGIYSRLSLYGDISVGLRSCYEIWYRQCIWNTSIIGSMSQFRLTHFLSFTWLNQNSRHFILPAYVNHHSSAM